MPHNHRVVGRFSFYSFILLVNPILTLEFYTLQGKEFIMFDFSIPELLIVLIIVILLFGPGRIAKTMGELGKGIQSFRGSFASAEKTDSISDTNITPK